MGGRSKSSDEAAADPAPRFEDALAQLEALVGKLESGDLDLEQALGTFESGVALAKLCAARLEAAELRIRKLEEGRDGPMERALELDEEDE
jgi:exodeoxyribonuclease VII small subunit